MLLLTANIYFIKLSCSPFSKRSDLSGCFTVGQLHKSVGQRSGKQNLLKAKPFTQTSLNSASFNNRSDFKNKVTVKKEELSARIHGHKDKGKRVMCRGWIWKCASLIFSSDPYFKEGEISIEENKYKKFLVQVHSEWSKNWALWKCLLSFPSLSPSLSALDVCSSQDQSEQRCPRLRRVNMQEVKCPSGPVTPLRAGDWRVIVLPNGAGLSDVCFGCSLSALIWTLYGRFYREYLQHLQTPHHFFINLLLACEWIMKPSLMWKLNLRSKEAMEASCLVRHGENFVLAQRGSIWLLKE